MKDIFLDKPLKVGGAELAKLSVRASTVGDEEDAQAMAADMGRANVPLTAELYLFSVITGVAYDDLRLLSAVDYEKIRKAYREVNQPGPLKKEPEPEQATGDSPPTPELN